MQNAITCVTMSLQFDRSKNVQYEPDSPWDLATHSKTPAAYTHGNSLCENTVGRVRDLAGTLMAPCSEQVVDTAQYKSWFVVMGTSSLQLVVEQVCSCTWMHTIRTGVPEGVSRAHD